MEKGEQDQEMSQVVLKLMLPRASITAESE